MLTGVEGELCVSGEPGKHTNTHTLSSHPQLTDKSCVFITRGQLVRGSAGQRVSRSDETGHGSFSLPSPMFDADRMTRSF